MEFFRPVFKLLNDAEVRYVAVGGVATILHGYVRGTTDIDLVIDLEPEQATKAIETLVNAGFAPHAPVDPVQFADPVVRESWIEEQGLKVFSMYRVDNALLSVDLFVREPIPFAELWERSEQVDLGDIKIRICALDDLISMKRESGRSKDLLDVNFLVRIKGYDK